MASPRGTLLLLVSLECEFQVLETRNSRIERDQGAEYRSSQIEEAGYLGTLRFVALPFNVSAHIFDGIGKALHILTSVVYAYTTVVATCRPKFAMPMPKALPTHVVVAE